MTAHRPASGGGEIPNAITPDLDENFSIETSGTGTISATTPKSALELIWEGIASLTTRDASGTLGAAISLNETTEEAKLTVSHILEHLLMKPAFIELFTASGLFRMDEYGMLEMIAKDGGVPKVNLYLDASVPCVYMETNGQTWIDVQDTQVEIEKLRVSNTATDGYLVCTSEPPTVTRAGQLWIDINGGTLKVRNPNDDAWLTATLT